MSSCRRNAVAITVLALALAGCSRDDGSQQNGMAQESDDPGDTFAEMLEQKYGIRMDGDAAVDIAKAACQAPIQGVGLYNVQQSLQQRYPDNSLNTVATVMSAGVLTYCPERLP